MRDVKIDRCEIVGGSIRIIELKNIIKAAIQKTNADFISFIQFFFKY